jgi:hypothetical protein
MRVFVRVRMVLFTGVLVRMRIAAVMIVVVTLLCMTENGVRMTVDVRLSTVQASYRPHQICETQPDEQPCGHIAADRLGSFEFVLKNYSNSNANHSEYD